MFWLGLNGIFGEAHPALRRLCEFNEDAYTLERYNDIDNIDLMQQTRTLTINRQAKTVSQKHKLLTYASIELIQSIIRLQKQSITCNHCWC